MLSRHKRSPRNLTLNDVYYQWAGFGGVMSSLTWAPWFPNPYYDSRGSDFMYHGVRSGGKFVAPLLYDWLDDDGHITNSGKNNVSLLLRSIYKRKWDHIWSLYEAEYDPLHTYNIIESRIREVATENESQDNRSVDLTDTTTYPQKSTSASQLRTPALSETTQYPSKSTSTSETRTPNITETVTVSDEVNTTVEGSDELSHGKVTSVEAENASTSQDNVFGFNTSAEEGVPESINTQSGTNASTETNSGTDSRETAEDTTSTREATTTTRTTGTETTTGSETQSYTGNQTVSKTGTETTTNTATESYTGNEVVARTGTDDTVQSRTGSETEEISSTKIGNIFKAPGELLSVDRDFWLTEFFSIVFDDIDSVLTLSIYSESEVYHKVF